MRRGRKVLNRRRRPTRRRTTNKNTKRIVKRELKNMGPATYDTKFICARDPVTSDNYANFPVLISNISQSLNLPRGFYVNLSRTLNTSQDEAGAPTPGVGQQYTVSLNQFASSSSVTCNARCSSVMEGAKCYHNWCKWNFYIQNVDPIYGMRVKVYVVRCKTTEIDVPKFFQGVGPPTLPQWATKVYEREYHLSPKPHSGTTSDPGASGTNTYFKKVAGFIRLNKEIRTTRSSYQVTSSGELTTERESIEKGHYYLLCGYSIINAGGATLTANIPLHVNGYIRSKFTDSI